MSVKLTPIRLPDGTFYRYAVRDPIGVEVLGGAFRRGWNEVADWTARSREVVEAEHDADGLHNTVKIARGLLAYASWPPPGNVLAEGSYLRGYDLAAVSLTYLGVGDYLISWDPIPFATVAVIGGDPNTIASGASVSGCKVAVFDSVGARADAPFSILIFGA
ncbi:MAG TPA: hypothetical protein VGD74_05535 [Vulgatibacter sp.]